MTYHVFMDDIKIMQIFQSVRKGQDITCQTQRFLKRNIQILNVILGNNTDYNEYNFVAKCSLQ